ncbi:Uncharacterised protein [Vibrio cholerae]|uniref:Uncharacterized protein n=1 Tax=Vibrio cholerae TaxID=666 RepID=A0A655S0J7_VIBCL|nr:Uncharacterised protein [Vibrio cholerae]CSB13441.1 Uncharacterised protein [Vibrio cholerae]CSC89544.1 Uncharacterised protein [Vibrio cholerae]
MHDAVFLTSPLSIQGLSPWSFDAQWATEFTVVMTANSSVLGIALPL